MVIAAIAANEDTAWCATAAGKSWLSCRFRCYRQCGLKCVGQESLPPTSTTTLLYLLRVLRNPCGSRATLQAAICLPLRASAPAPIGPPLRLRICSVRRTKCSVMLGLRCRRVNETIDTREDRSVVGVSLMIAEGTPLASKTSTWYLEMVCRVIAPVRRDERVKAVGRLSCGRSLLWTARILRPVQI